MVLCHSIHSLYLLSTERQENLKLSSSSFRISSRVVDGICHARRRDQVFDIVRRANDPTANESMVEIVIDNNLAIFVVAMLRSFC